MSRSFCRVSRAHPCPVCGKTDKCRVAPGWERIEVVECYRADSHLEKKCFKSVDNTVGTAHYHRLRENEAPRAVPSSARYLAGHAMRPKPTRNLSRAVIDPDEAGTGEGGVGASLQDRHRVCERLLELCPLSTADKRDNENRGLDTRRLGYGTLPSPARRKQVVDELESQFGRELLLGVPGFFEDQNGRLGLWVGEGLLVPVRGRDGQIMALRRRNPREDSGGGKWTWVSAGDQCNAARKGPSPGAPVHWARLGKGTVALLTEGERKADVIAAFLGNHSDTPAHLGSLSRMEESSPGEPSRSSGTKSAKFRSLGDHETAIVAIPGVSSWHASGVVEQLIERGIETVRIAYDMDLEKNRQVAKAALKLSAALADAGRVVEVVTWDRAFKGLDDALLAGAAVEVLAGERAEEFLCNLAARFDCTRQGDERADPRPEFVIVSDQDDNIRRALALIENDEFLFMLSGNLVHAASASSSDTAPHDEIDPRQSVQARIRQATPEFLAARLSGLCRPFEWRKSRKGDERIKVFCPFPVGLARQMIAVAGTAGHKAPREILGVLEGPTLDGEGKLIHRSGYCKIGGAGWYLAQAMPDLILPENPTKEECKQAERTLWEAVQYFPWKEEGDYHRWMMCLFAPLLRPLYPTCPLLLITANAPGSGKGYLASGISFIVHGRDMENTTWPGESKDKEEELRRSLSNWISAGTSSVCLDNLPDGASLESSTLCSFLTAPIFSCRLLGQNGGARAGGANSLTLYGTGNNIRPSGDLSQRCLLVRLDSPYENPRLRPPEQFGAIGDFSAYCRNRKNRVALLQAALTILRGFLRSPEFARKENCPHWGSFDGFARYVAGAVQWLTGANPLADLFTTFNTDIKASSLAAMLGRWKQLLGLGVAHSARSLAEWLQRGTQFSHMDPERDWGGFAESMENLGANLAKPRSIGRVLAQYCDRPVNVDGVLHRLTSRMDGHGIAQYSLVRAEAVRRAPQTAPVLNSAPIAGVSRLHASGTSGCSGFVSGPTRDECNGDLSQGETSSSEEKKTNPENPEQPEPGKESDTPARHVFPLAKTHPIDLSAEQPTSEQVTISARSPVKKPSEELFTPLESGPYVAWRKWRPQEGLCHELSDNESPPGDASDRTLAENKEQRDFTRKFHEEVAG